MKLERLSNTNTHLHENAFALYNFTSPSNAVRDRDEFQHILKKADYHFDLIVSNGSFVGIMVYWVHETFVFLEHFALVPTMDNEDYKHCALDLLKDKRKRIIVGVSPTCQSDKEFYVSNGFVTNSHTCIQPKHHLGQSDAALTILSFPTPMTDKEFFCFDDYLQREVGMRANVSSQVTVRKLQDGDDFDQVAKLIYLTDKYVYPTWFDSMDDAIKVIVQMMRLPTLYNKENITVAVMPNGFIAGMIVSKQTPFVEELKYILKAFELAGVEADGRTDYTFQSYYSQMGKSEDGYYIANVCVDEACRKQGIAATLLSHITNNHSFCSLECVVANSGPLRLYQRFGFEIAYEYLGVHDIPCYKMFYKK